MASSRDEFTLTVMRWMEAGYLTLPRVVRSAVGHPERGAITCAVNGELRQAGDLSELIWAVPEVVSILSRSVALAPGDLIMTGTPAGVGPLLPGDTCVGRIDGLGESRTPIGPAL